MEELESRVHTNKGLIDDINNQIDRVKSNLSNINELERNVKDNYRLHRLSREITEKEGYIVALRQEVGEYDSQIYKSKIIEHQRKKEELSTKVRQEEFILYTILLLESKVTRGNDSAGEPEAVFAARNAERLPRYRETIYRASD